MPRRVSILLQAHHLTVSLAARQILYRLYLARLRVLRLLYLPPQFGQRPQLRHEADPVCVADLHPKL
jgi:hypothetical protein